MRTTERFHGGEENKHRLKPLARGYRGPGWVYKEKSWGGSSLGHSNEKQRPSLGPGSLAQAMGCRPARRVPGPASREGKSSLGSSRLAWARKGKTRGSTWSPGRGHGPSEPPAAPSEPEGWYLPRVPDPAPPPPWVPTLPRPESRRERGT